MSKTDKTKPIQYQIDETTRRHGGRINWHTDVAFRRSKWEGEWIRDKKNRKNKDWKDNYDY